MVQPDCYSSAFGFIWPGASCSFVSKCICRLRQQFPAFKMQGLAIPESVEDVTWMLDILLVHSFMAKLCCLLSRCLSIEAPPPEEKLETLSDIAQEHGVEWDAAGAASEMLPSGAPPGFGQGGPSGQGGPPGQWGRPGPRGGNSGGGFGMGTSSGPPAAPDHLSGSLQTVALYVCRLLCACSLSPVPQTLLLPVSSSPPWARPGWCKLRSTLNVEHTD